MQPADLTTKRMASLRAPISLKLPQQGPQPPLPQGKLMVQGLACLRAPLMRMMRCRQGVRITAAIMGTVS